ncbi:MAG TPA: hypothetical protein GX506_00620 [Firmicutes bacterium]|nr:hypothetical protein [Bacillota bacterium]
MLRASVDLGASKAPVGKSPVVGTGINARRLVTDVSILLIVGGILLLWQPWSFGAYQLGFKVLIAGAFIQMIMGNLGSDATVPQAVRVFIIGTVIFLTVVGLAVFMAPRLAGLL